MASDPRTLGNGSTKGVHTGLEDLDSSYSVNIWSPHLPLVRLQNRQNPAEKAREEKGINLTELGHQLYSTEASG